MQQQFQFFFYIRVWWFKKPGFRVVENSQNIRVSGSGKPGLETLGSLRFFTTITTQNTLIKWKSDFWTYTTRHVGMGVGRIFSRGGGQ